MKGTFFILALLFLTLWLVPAPVQAWETAAIDMQGSGGKAGENVSIALDSLGAAHIACHNETLAALQYSTNASGTWVTTILETDAGRYTSIAVDGANNVHISYSGDGLKYATNASGSWTTVSIDVGSVSVLDNHIAIDGSGHVHICCYDFSGSDLLYVTNASGVWTTEHVGKVYSPFDAYASIAVDGLGKAHISYYDDQNEDLVYATNTSGAWVSTTLLSEGNVGEFNDIAVDAEDAVHISCFDRGNSTLKYLTNASGSWVTSDVDSGGMYTAIAVDGLGKVHIAHKGSAVKYATNASGDWLTTPILSGGIEQYISLALDDAGDVHLGYANDTGPYLFYIDNLLGYWLMTAVDSPGEMGLLTSIGVDSADGVHMDYYGGGLKYATDASGSWDREKVAPYVWAPSSVALDSNDKVHTSCSSYGSLEYITNATGAWVLLIIDSPLTAVDQNSIAVDDMDNVHIVYSCYLIIDYGEEITQNYDLKYATNASGSWVTTTVVSDGDAGLFSDMALDASGNVHISYVDRDAGALLYATNVSGSWETATVVSSGLAGETRTSIDVDDTGDAHISYYNDHELNYATNASGSWVTTVVDDSVLHVGFYNSIVVDGANAVHLAYSGDGILRYATNASGVWVTDTACDRFLGSGEYASLALGSDGTVFIGHHGLDGTLLLTSSGAIACVDNDGDGYGNPATPACSNPGLDCDDASPAIHPGAVEGPLGHATCTDGLDNNCNSLVDDADPGCSDGCFDEDGDGYGNPGNPNCDHPEWDCNDNNPSAHPGATEICDNGSDDDCDGLIDEGCGYAAVANAEASALGSGAMAASGASNGIGLVLLPLCAILLMRLRRGQR